MSKGRVVDETMEPAERPARQRLVDMAQRGGVTLVLGAGISIPHGIPSWDSLARVMWAAAFGKQQSPWHRDSRGKSPTEVPQFLPIVFELVYRELGETRFIATLKENLYANASLPGSTAGFQNSSESLAVLARLIVQEQKRVSRRRIDAIVTLNADDLLEQAVRAIAGPRRGMDDEVIRTVGRSTHSFLGGPRRRALPIYHVHGLVPAAVGTSRYARLLDHMIVFTDTQYWSTSASALSFANRVMASALGEGRCVFIGLSMTDINLLRWLAMRAFEKDRDLLSATHTLAQSAFPAQEKLLRFAFDRHFWIRPDSDDPSGFLSEFLKLRGVSSVAIDAWTGKSFQKTMERCFPARGRP